MLRRALGILTTVFAIGMAVALPAVADCMEDDRTLDVVLEEAHIAFVGTVVDVRDDTTGQFDVEVVWKGDVPARVTVLGGPDEPGVATSIDRTWRPGTRYLVVPDGSARELHDSQCSPTREWTDDLAEFRPATAGAPQPVPDDAGPSQGVVMGAAAVVLVLAVVATAVLVRPRRDGAA